jgi:hypothetical protein
LRGMFDRHFQREHRREETAQPLSSHSIVIW